MEKGSVPVGRGLEVGDCIFPQWLVQKKFCQMLVVEFILINA